MKALPCRSKSCLTLGASLPPNGNFPKGEPQLTARYCGEYSCARCGDVQRLSMAEFNGLPTLTLSDFDRLATQYHGSYKTLPIKDLVGAGLKESEAKDMFAAGFKTAHDVAELERD